jgi:hypothetical protein
MAKATGQRGQNEPSGHGLLSAPVELSLIANDVEVRRYQCAPFACLIRKEKQRERERERERGRKRDIERNREREREREQQAKQES